MHSVWQKQNRRRATTSRAVFSRGAAAFRTATINGCAVTDCLTAARLALKRVMVCNRSGPDCLIITGRATRPPVRRSGHSNTGICTAVLVMTSHNCRCCSATALCRRASARPSCPSASLYRPAGLQNGGCRSASSALTSGPAGCWFPHGTHRLSGAKSGSRRLSIAVTTSA